MLKHVLNINTTGSQWSVSSTGAPEDVTSHSSDTAIGTSLHVTTCKLATGGANWWFRHNLTRSRCFFICVRDYLIHLCVCVCRCLRAWLCHVFKHAFYCLSTWRHGQLSRQYKFYQTMPITNADRWSKPLLAVHVRYADRRSINRRVGDYEFIVNHMK